MCQENKIPKGKTKPEYARSSKWSANQAGLMCEQVGVEQGV